MGQRRALLREAIKVEERRPARRLRQYNVADVQARLARDDCVGVRRVDWGVVSRAGLFSTGPEAVAFSEPESSFQGGLLRLFVVARRLALRAAARGGQLDVAPGEAAGLRLR